MTGATVTLAHTHYTTTVQLDGTFTFRHIPAGKYQVIASTVGYEQPTEVDVEITSDNDIKEVGFAMRVSARYLENAFVTAGTDGRIGQGERSRLEQRITDGSPESSYPCQYYRTLPRHHRCQRHPAHERRHHPTG